MKQIAIAGARRRQPLVVLSLLLNFLLLGGTVMWWSGGITSSGGVSLNGSRRGSLQAEGFEFCERPQLNDTKLGQWGCKVFEKACFDQDGMLLHSGIRTPGHPNYSHDTIWWTHKVPSYVLPGYDEPLGTGHFDPACWDIHIRAPTPYDPADVWQPAEFSNCTVPVVWWLTYFSVFADLYLGSVLALDSMLADGAIDRNVTLAPVSIGLDVPEFYQPLLRPYTRHKVTTLSHISSREHALTGQPRCYERAVLCNMVGMYTGSSHHSWGELKPKSVGRRAYEFYRKEFPQEFQLTEQLAAAEGGTVFRVAFMPRKKMRSIRNLAAVVEECKKWKPPADTKFKSVDCVLLPDGTAENHVRLLALVQNVHALVNTHGSGNNYIWFMPNGTALVEIMPWNFHGDGCTWGDQYFAFSIDHTMNTGYFRLMADKNHSFKGAFEEKLMGSSIAWGRDQDVEVDFPTLAKALERIARGQLHCTDDQSNKKERYFWMTNRDHCPGHVAWVKERNLTLDDVP